MVDWYGEEKKKRKPIGKTEWEMIKSLHKNKCVLCGETERTVGKLIKAHIRAHSKGGEVTVPMCPNCHTKFDSGKLTQTQLKKLNITETAYKRLLPNTRKKTSDSTW